MYSCPYCQKDITVLVEPSADGATSGMMVACDCPDARAEWERNHRKQMERNKRIKPKSRGRR